MNTQHKVLCTHCGKLIPEAESDAHCATHEMTPIPAVASERERLISALEIASTIASGKYPHERIFKNAADMLRADAALLQRAQADALDARRYQLLRQLIDEDETFQVTEWLDNSTEELFITATDLDRRLDALRTSSPDVSAEMPEGEWRKQP